MRLASSFALLACAVSPLLAATFGTVLSPPGGAAYSDIVLDEPRGQLYLVNSSVGRIEVYSTKLRAFQTSIATDTQPVAAALSRDGRFLYVTTYTSSILDVIDLSQNQVTSRISLASNPEGIAVGGDGTVLITAIAAPGITGNTLIVYDPSTVTGSALSSVPVIPPPPTSPVLPTVAPGRVYLSYRSHLLTSSDGKTIIGFNNISATQTVVFVYEVASHTMLRSRTVTNLPSVLAVSADGSKFMAGSTLFDSQTLQVLAQENAANAPFTFPSSATAAGNFNLQQNQGGSVFSPDGNTLYAGFNVAATGAARADILLLNDPDNLLIQLGIQLPENLAGKMVIDAAGANIYALSDSGLTLLPVSAISNSPIAQPGSQVVLLTSDQCGVYAQNTASTPINNAGRGRFTVGVQPALITTTIVVPMGGGPGGPGGGVITTITTAANAPAATASNTGSTPAINFRFNPAAAANPGTTGPADFVVLSPEAINVPGNIHTFQNNRTPESNGTIIPVAINASAGEGLTDMLTDTARQRLYISNSGMNRVEVFDLKTQKFLAPVKVGQLPHAMALGLDGSTLYVANTGGESISIVDLNKGRQTGRVAFPALPLNIAITLVTPQTIAVSARGPQFVMSDGSVWKVIGNQAIPRSINPAIFGNALRSVPGGNPAYWTMAATPGGEFILLVTGTGTGYLYDYTVDDFTLTKQIHTTITGYAGPVTAGPNGSYYAVGGTILNSSLTQVQGTATGFSTSGRPVAAVAALSANAVAEFTQPLRANPTSTVADSGQIEIYNPGTGALTGSFPSLEGAPSVVIGTTRVPAFARTLALDAAGTNAYVLTASGLSIVPLTAAAPGGQSRPVVKLGGVVNVADSTSGVAAGGLISIFGSNLGSTTSATAPFPTLLGGTCLTLNNQPIPLLYVSDQQINAQIPTTLAPGRYPLVVHSTDNKTVSATTNLTVAKYAPAIFGGIGQSAILHLDGSYVTPDNPTTREQYLMIFATGLGPTHGGSVLTGQVAPTSPLAAVCDDIASCSKLVEVYFGPPLDSRTRVQVDWAGLTPGYAGVYQINVRVYGIHLNGSGIPVTVKVGGVSSSTTGPLVPTVSIE